MWPFGRRKKQREEAAAVYVGRHRPGSWGEVALPPGEAVLAEPVSAPATPVITPSQADFEMAVLAPVVPTPVAPLPVPPTLPMVEANRVDVGVEPPLETVTLAPRPAKVRLGFADGSSMDIAEYSDFADKLQEVAHRLVGEDVPANRPR